MNKNGPNLGKNSKGPKRLRNWIANMNFQQRGGNTYQFETRESGEESCRYPLRHALGCCRSLPVEVTSLLGWAHAAAHSLPVGRETFQDAQFCFLVFGKMVNPSSCWPPRPQCHLLGQPLVPLAGRSVKEERYSAYLNSFYTTHRVLSSFTPLL